MKRYQIIVATVGAAVHGAVEYLNELGLPVDRDNAIERLISKVGFDTKVKFNTFSDELPQDQLIDLMHAGLDTIEEYATLVDEDEVVGGDAAKAVGVVRLLIASVAMIVGDTVEKASRIEKDMLSRFGCGASERYIKELAHVLTGGKSNVFRNGFIADIQAVRNEYMQLLSSETP